VLPVSLTNSSVCCGVSPDLSGSDSSLPYSRALPGRHFPAFMRYYEGAKTAWPPSRPLVVHSRPDTSVDPACLLAAASESPRLRRDVVQPVASYVRRISEELPNSPMFTGNPLAPLPCSFRSRSGLNARSYGVSILPPLLRYEGPNVQPVIGIQSHGFNARCLRFMPPSRTTMQDSLRCGDHPFTNGICTRRIPIERFSCSMSYVILLPPRSLRFHGAT
jgi:hypothetical protein